MAPRKTTPPDRIGKVGRPRKSPTGELAPRRKPRNAEGQDLEPTIPRYNPDTERWENGNGQPICGANRTGKSSSGPGKCCNLAGLGTSHVGYGKCKFHGGSTEQGQKAGLREKLFANMPILGSPIAIGPHQAVLEEIHRTAGHVHWLNSLIQYVGIDPDDYLDDDVSRSRLMAITQFGKNGMEPSVWIKVYQSERKHLVEVCRAAVSMGVAERTVAIIEENARTVAAVIMAIFNDTELGLDADQRRAFPTIARRHLTALPTPELPTTPAPTSQKPRKALT